MRATTCLFWCFTLYANYVNKTKFPGAGENAAVIKARGDGSQFTARGTESNRSYRKGKLADATQGAVLVDNSDKS